MQINRIECELGVTVNAGDFQSVKGTVKMTADLDRGEDALEAYTRLAATVHTSLVEGLRISHPNTVKGVIEGNGTAAQARIAAPSGATAAQTEEQKRKPGRPPKAAVAAPKAAETPKQADTAEGMSIGGLDGEDGLDGLGNLDGLDGLEEEEKPVTRDEVLDNLKRLVKVGGQTALKELLTKHGVTNFSQLPEDKYAAINKDALKQIGALAGRSA